MNPRHCQDCNTDISDRHKRAYLCEDCAFKRKRVRLRKQSHNYWMEITKPLGLIERAISGNWHLEMTGNIYYPHPFEKLQSGLVELPRKKQLEFIERWERFFPEGTPQPRTKRCRSCKHEFWSFDPNPALQFTREILEVPDDTCLGCFEPEGCEPEHYTREKSIPPLPPPDPPKPKPPKPLPPPDPPKPSPSIIPKLAMDQRYKCDYCGKMGAASVTLLGEFVDLCPACRSRHREFIEK